MKKKVLSVFLVVALIAITAMGTLAYFTDTDSADNVFALGNVDIQLVERQRDYVDGQHVANSELETFEDGKLLMPIVGSAQGDKDENGFNLAKNYLDKIVDVKNNGNQPAYVRVLMTFPQQFDADRAADMMVHWNNEQWKPYNWTPKMEAGTYTDESGVVYNIYSFTYNDILPAGETTTSHALVGIYMDSRVDVSVDENGVATYTLGNQSATFPKGYNPQIKVFAQAIQAQGFDSPAEAFATSGMSTNPWVE